MICPNCGRPYTEDEKICKNCHSPLSNAEYSPLDPAAAKKSRRKHGLLIVSLVLVFLIVGGVVGYHVYISIIEKKCRETTEQIFSCAEKMDFTEFSDYDLPEPLKSEPNVKNLIKSELNSYIETAGLSSLIDANDIDMDALFDAITEHASYKITDVTADYHSCTVTVNTSNLDFASLPATIYESASAEVTDTDSSFWTTIRDGIASLFGNGEETQEDSSENLSEKFQTWLDEAIDNAPRTETTGTIVYGIEDGKWTLISYDQALFYSYYGLEATDSAD